MSCPVCGDKGVVRIRFEDGSTDAFGVCRCEVGQRMRHQRNAIGKPCEVPLWHIWAAREQVPLDQIHMLEELVDERDLASIPVPDTLDTSATDIAAAMRIKKPRL